MREQLLSGEQVAAIFGVCRRTVERMAAAGRLPVVRIGVRTVRYRESDVQSLLSTKRAA